MQTTPAYSTATPSAAAPAPHSAPSRAQAASSFPSSPARISPAALYILLQEGLACRLLDVRSPAEFESAHVEGAVLQPLDQLSPSEWALSSGGEKGPLFVFCQAGGRAGRAAERLHQAGVPCTVVEGGLDAWIGAGLPVKRTAPRVLPLMRQVQIVIGLVSAAGAALALGVHPLFSLIPLFTGLGLLFAGLTGTCGLALLLARMPWNQSGAPKASAPSCCSVSAPPR